MGIGLTCEEGPEELDEALERGASGVVATSFVPGRDLSSVQRVEGSILTGDALVKRLKSGTSRSLHHRSTRASPTLMRDAGQRSSLSEGGSQWH